MAQDIVHYHETAADVARAVAEDFIVFTAEVIEETGSCIVGISGGTTPNAMFSLMNEPAYRERIDWGKIFFLWVDERFVPQDDPDNNYARARERLFNHLEGFSHYYPVPTHKGTVEEAAVAYEEEVHAVLDACGKQSLDLVLLGLGDDGHTASLFPRSEVLLEGERFIAAVKDGKVWQRVTMTFPFLATAHAVWFTVVGESKAVALHKVFKQRALYEADSWEKRINHTLPGAVLCHVPLHWYVDKAAAEKL